MIPAGFGGRAESFTCNVYFSHGLIFLKAALNPEGSTEYLKKKKKNPLTEFKDTSHLRVVLLKKIRGLGSHRSCCCMSVLDSA